MQITKHDKWYTLETGCAVIVFDDVLIQMGKTPDLELEFWGINKATIPNQHIKEFEKAFIAVGGVIE